MSNLTRCTPVGRADFRQALGLWDSVAIITAIVVGVGIFRTPAEVAGYLSHPAVILAAWLLGGIICLLGALCYAELSAAFPKTGGNYIYLRQAYGKLPAFLFAWAEFFAIRTGSIAAVAFIGAEYLQSFLSINASFIKPMAVFIVLFLSCINMFGLRGGKKVHNVFTALNIAALISIILSGFIFRRGDMSHFFAGSVSLDGNILRALGLALIPILWTYGGWHENTFMSEETNAAAKTIPRALIIAILIITLLYLAVNFFYIYMMPVKDLSASAIIGSDIFNLLYGPGGRKIFEALVVAASLGSINAMIITGARITFAASEDSPFFSSIAKLSSKHGVPQRAIAINAAWCLLLIALGNFNKLLFFTGILVWLFFAAAAAGIFVLRKKSPGLNRPYKVPGYPATPAVFALICAALFINALIFNPLPSIFGLFLLLSGVPVYFLSCLRQRRKNG
ncbi:MAG: hypothetical protein COV72_05630 [Candidatus Omnitrophica bacterium CG11_big_fil_rev_8_21_14_0_20_42_13]|uniref:Amino acid permease n=1 Tax=Candidatus Ghiorseimicrobium undicola TaxID=1974746 RepID=A0A2H0LX46_9BACT|nr:MAG: hypothetical protein COV72_05630 [Candidatus Omnitrophica bacterium CG11_big_fil_rev_8_21_14_0_20_42_13]